MFSPAEIEANLAALIGDLDPTGVDPVGLVDLIDRLGRIERLAAAGIALVAAEVDRTGLWRGTGARDAIGYVAGRTGATRSRLRDGQSVISSLGSLPRLDGVVRAGDLTISQAADIAAAASARPDTETELVDLAARVSPRRLKARCVELLAEGEGAEEQHRRARAERTCSSRVGRDVIWRMGAALPVIDGALVDKALDYFQTQIFDDARRAGHHEPYDAYRADALVAMANAALGQPADHPRRRRGTPRPGSAALRHTIVITVPHTALLSSEPVPGETSQIPGVGPVPISVVRRLLADGDPVVKAVITRGRDITATATLTRTIKEDLRLAVLVAADMACAVPDCDHNRFLELDHPHDYAKGGPTSYDNLRPLCGRHHHQRTTGGYELHGTPGNYRWVGPDGTVLAAERQAAFA